jgi:CBS domain-containing protein
MKIHDIMTRDPSCVTPDATVREAAQLMKRDDVGIVPVIDGQSNKTLVGVISDRDIAIRCVADGRDSSVRVRDCMTASKVATCRENEDVDRAMDAMRTEQVRRIPIVDERGSLVGIVAQADIVRKTRNDAKAEDTIEQISQPGGRHSS